MRTLSALRGGRRATCARWEALLRIERVNTPLANPDALIHQFDWTLRQVFSELERSGDIIAAPWPANEANGDPFACECGCNPFVAYFRAARQALMEALVLEQSENSNLDPIERDGAAAELRASVNKLAQSEISAFCAVCARRRIDLRDAAPPQDVP